MSLVCYLDDSGNEDDPIVTLAGYIAPAVDWLNFEVHARELFDAHKLPYLHTMDLHQRKREFKGAVTVTGWCQLRVASSFLL